MVATPVRVSILALPDGVISTLGGIYDVLSFCPVDLEPAKDRAADPTFAVEIVAEEMGEVPLASGLPITATRSVSDVAATDIIVVPSMIVGSAGWRPGRYPVEVAWLKSMAEQGATLCSACSGIFLLAETGLFDGIEATVHWSYAAKFKSAFPGVLAMPEKVLIVAGDRQHLITSGASNNWHSLVLYLIAKHAGPAAALAVARFSSLEWNRDGLAPFMVFEPGRDHGDAAVLEAQDWLVENYPVANPVEEMVKRSGHKERTFKRRFSQATGLSPINYVQKVRIEEAKRALERTATAIDEISWQVGYEDPAFFRRLFKRTTGLTPGAYRRKFSLSNFDTV